MQFIPASCPCCCCTSPTRQHMCTRTNRNRVHRAATTQLAECEMIRNTLKHVCSLSCSQAAAKGLAHTYAPTHMHAVLQSRHTAAHKAAAHLVSETSASSHTGKLCSTCSFTTCACLPAHHSSHPLRAAWHQPAPHIPTQLPLLPPPLSSQQAQVTARSYPFHPVSATAAQWCHCCWCGSWWCAAWPPPRPSFMLKSSCTWPAGAACQSS